MILLIDNYDSFTYNLYHYLVETGKEKVVVKRNDDISIEEIKAMKPAAIVLSPGPCTPNEAGICLDVIKEFKGVYPILGICLGHQAIGQAFGGTIVKNHPMHGKVSDIYHEGENLFKGLTSPFKAARYHSLSIEKETCPKNLNVTSWTKDGMIMGIADETLKIFGVQFHPESIASEFGHQIIKNFLDII